MPQLSTSDDAERDVVSRGRGLEPWPNVILGDGDRGTERMRGRKDLGHRSTEQVTGFSVTLLEFGNRPHDVPHGQHRQEFHPLGQVLTESHRVGFTEPLDASR